MRAAGPLELSRPRDVPALLGDSLAVYRRNAGTFLALAAAVVVPVELVVQGIGLERLTAPYDESPSPAEAAVAAVVGLLVVAPLVTAICIHALRGVAAGGSPGARESIVAGFEAFTPIFLAVLLAAAGIALGLAALIIPGVYLAVRWYFVPQAVVLEGARGPGALARSGRAVTGFWWRTLGLVLLANVAALIPAALLSAPFTAIAESSDRAAWALAGSMAAEIVTAPFVALFSTLVWFDLGARRQRP